MSARQNNTIGDEIAWLVQEAVKHGVYLNLSRDIKRTVNASVNASFREVKSEPPKKERNIYELTKPSKIKKSKPLLIVGAIFLFSAFSIFLDEFPFLFLLDEGFYTALLMGVIPFAIGLRRKKMANRLNTYFNLSKSKGYVSLSELSKVLGKSKDFLIKDIYNMMQRGILPEAHIDESETYFILDNETYHLYEQMKIAEVRNTVPTEDLNEVTKEVTKDSKTESKVVSIGRDYIRQINKANDAIPGEEISQKLSNLAMIMDRIFSYVHKHPDAEDDIRKFMEYYLPTTLKLVNAYKEFDAQPVQGENIQNAKREIEDSLDTINSAFSKLFDDMFEEVAMDISTDIDVLNTLFTQDGLK